MHHLSEEDKDKIPELFLSGRHQQISADPAHEFPKTTLAAGAVLWRGDRQSPKVAVIHRPHYDDWSLAKGKVDPGESLPVTAVREIEEETGYQVKLGKLLGKVTYPVQGRTKVVYYWMAEVVGGKFTKNSEVDEIRWLSTNKAAKLLSYEVDKQVLRKAEKRLKLSPTTRILYVRHARAHQRKNWSGNDDLRPLDKKGRLQADLLVPLLKPYQPDALYTAQPQRCQQTVAPLAAELNAPIHTSVMLGDEGISQSVEQARAAFDKIVSRGGTAVVVSQGATIPGIVDQLNPGFIKLEKDQIKAKKASVWVLSFNDGILTGADYLASPLPVK